MVATVTTIRKYQSSDQRWFEQLNRAWIETHFKMEPLDTLVLQHPETYILGAGGHILIAEYNNRVAGTVALKVAAPNIYELTKMAVMEELRGKQIGLALARAAIDLARTAHAEKVVLYSNKKLEAAVSLYNKLGFREVPLDAVYVRSDIKMELKVS